MKKILIFFVFLGFLNASEYYSDKLVKKINETISQKKACEQNDLKACYEIAKKYEYGVVLRQNYPQAYKYYLKAAKTVKETPEATMKFAYFLHYGLGIKQDFNSAYKVYKALCISGYKEHCANQNELEKALNGKFDIAKELEKACESGDGEKCYIINRYALSGKTKDHKKGAKYALKACLNGFDYACGVGFYELKNSEKKKFEISQKRCKEGSGVFCSKVADYYEYGIEGSGKDNEKSVEFHKKACELGLVSSCVSVALNYSNPYYSDGLSNVEIIKKIDSAILIENKICHFAREFKEQDLEYVCDFVSSAQNTKIQILNPEPKQEYKPPFTPLPKDEQIPLGKMPDNIASALLYYEQLAGIPQGLICDDENSVACKEHLKSECANAGTKDDIKSCKENALSWNSSFSGRHARYANQAIMSYLKGVATDNYKQDEFLYFLKYIKNLGVSALDILSQNAGSDARSDDEAAFISWLIKNNAILALKDIRAVFGSQAQNHALIALLKEHGASDEIREIFIKEQK